MAKMYALDSRTIAANDFFCFEGACDITHHTRLNPLTPFRKSMNILYKNKVENII